MALREFCGAAIESMTNGKDSDKKRDAYVDFLAVFFAFLISFVILGFVGKLLWNAVVVELFSIAKPAKSFWQIIGLMIFVMLLRP
jgi:cytoskeletal protein RodZ